VDLDLAVSFWPLLTVVI